MSDIVDTGIVKGDQRASLRAEMYGGHTIITAFGREKKFDQLNETYYDSPWRAQFVRGIIMPT